MWRLYFLIERCYRSREPVLLVGETGGGKTTVCQVLSAVLGSKLHILNCHQYTETSDFIGVRRCLVYESCFSRYHCLLFKYVSHYLSSGCYLQGFCPIRDRSRIAIEFKDLVVKIKGMKMFVDVAGNVVSSVVSGCFIIAYALTYQS
jgi:midasin